MNEVTTIHKCPWCNVSKPLRGLACHAGRVHGKESKELHLIVLHGGTLPKCACGCGQDVAWLQRRFGAYLRGHNGFNELARKNAVVSRKTSSESTANVLEIEQLATNIESMSSVVNADVVVPVVTSRVKKASILDIAGGWTDCDACGGRWPKHIKVLECPRCGPTTTEARSSFNEFASSLGLTLTPSDGSWRSVTGDVVVWLDRLHDHTLPGPLVKRDEVERETIAASTPGVKVARFYEDEWNSRRVICRSLLQHRMGVSPNRIGARSLSLVELGIPARKEFFEQCHLEGDARAIFCYALVDASNVPKCAVSVRQPFHRGAHAGKLEVARFACEPELSVMGGLSRLLEVAHERARNEGASALLTYADGRLGDGDGYEKVGFERIGRGTPRLWWTDYKRRINRFAIRADSQNGITQNARAVEQGVVELWGCSNSVFLKQM